MNNVAIVAIDLGKHTFHLHAQDDRGHELYHKKFNRAGLARHLANLEPCTVAMEACGSELARDSVLTGNVYLANNCPISLNALNSSAFPQGSNRNIVACSPTSP